MRMKTLLRICFVFLVCCNWLNGFSQTQWGAWESIYKDADIDVQIQFKISPTACDASGKPTKFRYNLIGNLKPGIDFVNWKVKYIDCNGHYFYQQYSVNIGSGGSLGEIESMDYLLTSSKIISTHYDAVASNSSLEGNGELKISEAPKSISGNLSAFAGAGTKLTVEGGVAEAGAEWVWYEGPCGSVKKIGSGLSINVTPTKNTAYSVRAENGKDATACVQCLVKVSSKGPDFISGESSICIGEVCSLTVEGGGLLEGGQWTWYEGKCGGKKVGTGKTVRVSPVATTEYFVRGENRNNDFTSCVSVKVPIISKEQRKKEVEEKRIAEEQIRKQAEAKLRIFLKDRATLTYKYREENNSGYINTRREIKDALFQLAAYHPTINFTGTANFLVDTLTNTHFSLTHGKSYPLHIEDSVKLFLANIKLKPAMKMGYAINAKDTFNVSISKSSEKFTLKKVSDTSVKLVKGNEHSFLSAQSVLVSDFNSKSLPSGSKCTLLYSQVKVNDSTITSTRYLSYKGNGTARCAVYSFLIPGLGNHFVNENKKKPYWLITTAVVGGLIAGGVLSTYLSKVNYTKYLDASNQTDIDKYYKDANSYHALAHNCFIYGTAWLAVDVAIVAFKGAKNKERNERIKQNLSIP